MLWAQPRRQERFVTARRMFERCTTTVVAATVALVLAASLTVVGIATASATTKRAVVLKSVRIKSYKFLPSKFTVKAGTSVTVKNLDGVTHDLAAVNGAFKTKYIEGGSSGKFTVKAPGTYKIVCTLHTDMTGTIKAT
jgi:plastocyanin